MASSDGFVDILAEFRSKSDIGWAIASKNFPKLEKATSRTPQEITDAVLASEKVTAAIREEAIRRDWSEDAVRAEAREIGAEMGHEFGLKSLRGVGYAVHKVFQRIFRNVFTNPAGISKIRDLSREYPVVFLPTHKTYMDFLLLSYVCFNFELNPPAIASAMDFMSMKFIGEALRKCGAFFMRRSFGGDKLYWAIFSEYVQTHIRNGDRPLEFFIEGTRSRTGKNLHPKVGLLSVALEPFFKRDVFDVMIVPVSISYSKVLEESLYAYELLGFSKPKESTSGLWKARSILETDFGDVFIHFSDPISIRQYFNAKFDVSVPPIGPANGSHLNMTLKNSIKTLAHEIVTIHQQHSVVSTWSLICIVMNQILAENGSGDVSFKELRERVEVLYNAIDGMGKRIRMHTGSCKEEILHNVNLHSNVVELSGDPESQSCSIKLKPVAASAVNTRGRLSSQLIDTAVPRILASNYANKSLHLLVEPAYVILAFVKRLRTKYGKDSKVTVQELEGDFTFLQNLFGRDFVFVPGSEKESFVASVSRLCSAGILIQEQGGMLRVGKAPELQHIHSILRPFLLGYWSMAEHLSRESTDIHHLKSIHSTQDFICDTFLSNNPQDNGAPHENLSNLMLSTATAYYQTLSTDLLKNAFHAIHDLGVVKKLAHDQFELAYPRKLYELKVRVEGLLNFQPKNQSHVPQLLAKI